MNEIAKSDYEKILDREAALSDSWHRLRLVLAIVGGIEMGIWQSSITFGVGIGCLALLFAVRDL